MYVRCDNGDLYALNEPAAQRCGRTRSPEQRRSAALAVSGGTVYVTTSSASGNGLVAISASTHKQQWSFKAAATLNAPAIAGNAVYAVAQSGILYRAERRHRSARCGRRA